MEREHTARSQKWIVKVWVAAIILCVGGTAGLSFVLPRLEIDVPLYVGSVAGVEQITGVKFPEGTVFVEAKYRCWALNPQLVARLEMPNAQVDALFQQPPFNGKVSRGAVIENGWNFHGQNAVKEWHPETAEKSILGDSMYPGSTTFIKVQAALDDSPMAAIYLVWAVT